MTPNELGLITETFCSQLGVDNMVLAPTSEYITTLVRDAEWGRLPSRLRVYPSLNIPYRIFSSKEFLYEYVSEPPFLHLPRRLEGRKADIPFMAKPRVNVKGLESLKPFSIATDEDLRRFTERRDLYFAQELIPGPSYYYCAYRSPDGVLTSYWQANLLQMPAGGSISLAVRLRNEQLDSYCLPVAKLVEQVAFVGPFMAEFRGPDLALIEINPRFWGPLLLDLTSQGHVLASYYRDIFNVEMTVPSEMKESDLYLVPSFVEESCPANVNLIHGTDDKCWHLLFENLGGFSPRRLGGEW